MNALRRLCLAIYSLLLIAGAGALIALTWADDQQFNWTVGGWNFQALVNASDAGKIVFTIILGAIALVGLLTLLLAVFRESVSGQRGSLRLRQTDGGTIEVTGRAIESLLRDELQRLPDVRSVTPKVRIVGGAVDTSMDAVIAPTANIATVTSTLSQGVANILRDQVGVTNVRRPSIRIEQAAAPGYNGAAGTPMPASSYAPAPAAPADEIHDDNAPVAPTATRPVWSGTAPAAQDDTQVVREPLPTPPSQQEPSVSDSTLPPPPPIPAETGTQSSQGHWEGDRWEGKRE